MVNGRTPQRRVSSRRQEEDFWVVIKIDGRHAGRQNVNHSHTHESPIEPVLLVEGPEAVRSAARSVLLLQQRRPLSAKMR